jgi:hypothetical protein
MLRWNWLADTHSSEFIPARDAPAAVPACGYLSFSAPTDSQPMPAGDCCISRSALSGAR